MTTLAITHLAPIIDSLSLAIDGNTAQGEVWLTLPHLQNEVCIGFTATFDTDGEYCEEWDYDGNYKAHHYDYFIHNAKITAWAVLGLADETEMWTPTPADKAKIVEVLAELVESQEI